MRINSYVQGKPFNNNKHKAVKSIWKGIWNGEYRTLKFDSKGEMGRFTELRLLERSGVISGLELQKKFELVPKQVGERAVSCRVDFFYQQNGKSVVEEFKGPTTRKLPDYVIKRKLFKLNYPDIEHREVIR